MECVRPGGKPTDDHCFLQYSNPGLVTTLIFAPLSILVLALTPVIAIVRTFFPEHRAGVNRNDKIRLILFLIRHPIAIQGEGPSNGDGLAAMGASETSIYPITKKLDLKQGDRQPG